MWKRSKLNRKKCTICHRNWNLKLKFIFSKCCFLTMFDSLFCVSELILTRIIALLRTFGLFQPGYQILCQLQCCMETKLFSFYVRLSYLATTKQMIQGILGNLLHICQVSKIILLSISQLRTVLDTENNPGTASPNLIAKVQPLDNKLHCIKCCSIRCHSTCPHSQYTQARKLV